MKIVAHGVLVGEALENRNVPCLHVIEGHRVASAIVVDLVGNGEAEGVNFTRIGGDDVRIQVVQATRGIPPCGIADIAIRLLPHLKEPVGGVAGVGIVGQTCSRKRNGPFGK